MSSTTPIKNAKVIAVISNYHQLIHESKGFNVYHLFVGVADDAEANILLLLPANREVHLTVGIGASGAAEVGIFEKPAASNLGTQITPINFNREIPLKTKFRAFHTPTLTDDGARIDQDYIFGATQTINKVGGASLRDGEEWVLKAGNGYLIKVTNKAGEAANIMIRLNIYEYTI